MTKLLVGGKEITEHYLSRNARKPVFGADCHR